VPSACGLILVIGTEPGGVILGGDEGHLDFRICLAVGDCSLNVSTLVRFDDLIFQATLEQTRRPLFDAASDERRAA